MVRLVQPRWGYLAAQVAVVGGAVVVSLITMQAAVVVMGILAVVGVLVLESLKTRAIRTDARAGASAAPELDFDQHADRVQALTESRLAIVEAFEIERARIERDLHDGAQQYLVAASMKVGEAALALGTVATQHPDDELVRTASTLLERAQDDTATALAALRETVAGVHSPLLAEQGLEAAVRELAARLSRADRRIEVRVPHPLPALPQGVAAAAWFFASEALTNATKHAPGAPVSIVVAADNTLHLSVVDEGPGGARIIAGHGLAGMRERLGAFGGVLDVTSPEGGPTTVAARIPLLLRPGEPGFRIGIEGTQA